MKMRLFVLLREKKSVQGTENKRARFALMVEFRQGACSKGQGRVAASAGSIPRKTVVWNEHGAL